MLNHTKRQGNIKTTNMFITAVCIVFLIKLRWPSNKSLYETNPYILKIYHVCRFWLNVKSNRFISSSISVVMYFLQNCPLSSISALLNV